DEAATLAATDPGRFRREAEQAITVGADFTEIIARDHRHLPPAALRDWLNRARAAYLRAFAGLDPSARLPWYGPPMSAASSVTARTRRCGPPGPSPTPGWTWRRPSPAGPAPAGRRGRAPAREMPVAPTRTAARDRGRLRASDRRRAAGPHRELLGLLWRLAAR